MSYVLRQNMRIHTILLVAVLLSFNDAAMQYDIVVVI